MSQDEQHASQETQAQEQLPKDGKQEFAIHQECAALIHAITGNYRLTVTTDLDPRFLEQGKDPNSIWFAKYKQDVTTGMTLPEIDYVRIPEKIRERRVESAYGKALHEGAHVISSRFAVIPESVMKLQGFSGLMAAIEERPTDQVARERVAAGNDWINSARRDSSIDILEQVSRIIERMQKREVDTAEDSSTEIEREDETTEDSEQDKEMTEKTYDLHAIAEVVKGKARSRYQDFCSLLVYEPHQSYEEIVALSHPDAVAAYEQIREHVERIEQTTPAKGATEAEIQKKQQVRYALTFKHLLPVVQKLIVADIEDARKRAMEDAKMRQAWEESTEPDQLKETVDTLCDERDELHAERIKKEAEKIQIMTSDATEEEKNKEIARIQTEIDAIDKRIEEIRNEIWNLLPDWLKELIQAFAKRYIEDVEDALIAEHGGKFSPKPIKTNEQRRIEAEESEQAAAEEQAREDERERVRQEQENVQERLNKTREDKSYYEREYAAIRHLEEELYGHLHEILYPNKASQTTFHSTGTNINLQKLFLWKGQKAGGAKEVSIKPFEQVRHPEAKDYAITIVVDLSASMQGDVYLNAEQRTCAEIEKNADGSIIKEALRAAIILTEVLNRLGIRFSLVGMQNKAIVFKSPDEEVTNEVRERITGMLYEVWGVNPGGNNKGGDGNADGECIAEVSEMLEHEHASEKIIIVVSDGIPTTVGERGTKLGIKNASDHLMHEIKRIITQTDQKLIGLGVGKGTEHVEKFYPLSKGNVDIHQLAQTLAEILMMVISSPEVLAEAVEDMKRRLNEREEYEDNEDW